MEMTFHQILGYLHHAQAIEASEQLETYQTARLLHLTPRDRHLAIVELQRVADGKPAPTVAEIEAGKRAEFDAGWAGLRRRLGLVGGATRRGGRQPGERVVVPAVMD